MDPLVLIGVKPWVIKTIRSAEKMFSRFENCSTLRAKRDFECLRKGL